MSKLICALSLLLLLATFPGCDWVYRMVQKEGAEEKYLLGDLIPGRRNEKVAEIQKLLKLYGYPIGSADGVLGANTRKAVQTFQKDSGLKETRFVDQPTWAKLHDFEKYGLVTDAKLRVPAVEQALKAAGFDVGTIDGKMGNRTLTAIKEFQKKEGLKPDGRIGLKTLRALSSYLTAEDNPYSSAPAQRKSPGEEKTK